MQSSYLQTRQWANFKSGFGWQYQIINNIFILSRQLPYINQTMLYTPEFEVDDVRSIDELVSYAKSKKPLFLRMEILDRIDSKNADSIIQKLKKIGFVKAFEELQPEHRQIIDLAKKEENILQDMKEKGRYNTRLAQKKGVQVEIIKGSDKNASEKLKIFYDLYQNTSQRKSISGRNYDYFAQLLKNFKDKIVLALAYYNNTPLAGSLTILHNGCASYLYGGSSLEYKEMMAPYLLHFEVIKYAKAQGCKAYDLLAIAPPNDVNHRFANLTRFKQQFGGESVELIGSYDLIFKPFWYNIFKILEMIRRQ